MCDYNIIALIRNNKYDFCDKLVSAVDNTTGNVKLRSSHFTISIIGSRPCRQYPNIQLRPFYCKPSTRHNNNIISEDPRIPISLKGSNTKSGIIIKSHAIVHRFYLIMLLFSDMVKKKGMKISSQMPTWPTGVVFCFLTSRTKKKLFLCVCIQF